MYFTETLNSFMICFLLSIFYICMQICIRVMLKDFAFNKNIMLDHYVFLTNDYIKEKINLRYIEEMLIK